MSRSTYKKQEAITDENYRVSFGRYEGRTVKQILDMEGGANWIVWASKNDVLDLHYVIVEKAEGLHRPIDWFDAFQAMDEKEWEDIRPENDIPSRNE